MSRLMFARLLWFADEVLSGELYQRLTNLLIRLPQINWRKYVVEISLPE